MIKKIYFQRDKKITKNPEFKINFTEKTNIIIGPKGGGKSTLLNLLIGAANGYISKGVEDALKHYNYEAIKIELISGENIIIRNLEKKPKKEFEGKVNKLDNVIWQNDEIKYKLDNVKEINKDKKKFLDDILIGNEDVKNIINKMNNIHQKFKKLFTIIDKSINWDNIHKITDNKEKAGLIIGLQYSNFDERNKNDKNSDEIDKILKNLRLSYENIKDINHDHFIDGHISKDKLEEKKKKLLQEIMDIGKLIKLKKEQNNKINKTFLSFEKALKSTKTKIVNESKGDKIIEKFTTDSKFHFQQMAKITKNIRIDMKKMIKDNENIIIKMGNTQDSGILTLKAKDEVKIEKNLIFDMLSKILYKANSIDDVENWIHIQVKKNSLKEFKEKNLMNLLKEYLMKHVHVMADGKEYSSLSNGQKSIFGIRFKLNKAKLNSDILFLDQPEDDLDNETIKSELVDSINKFHGQKIIVTHNANIGLLTGADNVIVANFENEIAYIKGNKEMNEKKYSDAANYLEGGFEALNERHKIISGGKGDN